MSQLENKVNQRLYLSREVSPGHLILDLSLDSDKLTDRVIQYFKGKDTEKIVLKHPDLAVGLGNIFINNSINKENVKNGIESLRKMYRTRSGSPKYLLSEEQKIFPRISRKTKEEKDGYLTFRIVGIATKEGGLEYFIATKSFSEGANSHERKKMKCYFGRKHTTIDRDNADHEWESTYVGPKDKYFNIGERKIPINENTIQRIFKAAYHLYHDIKSHSKTEFQEHIAKCVKAHNNKEDYCPFMDDKFQKLEAN